MISLVCLEARSHSQLEGELTAAGYRIFEALAVSEVLFLQEHESIDAVIIAADVPNQREKAGLFRGIVISLEPHATAADVKWELSLLFADSTPLIQ